jgi:hypothetical protein
MLTLISKARTLMRKQTRKNKAPAWALTEIALAKGKELCKKYKVREELVITALYLAHIEFSTIIKGRVQKNHEQLSAHTAEHYLTLWKVPKNNAAIILNAIQAHHDKVPALSKEAEVMKNAECFKFLTLEGAVIYLHDLGTRKMHLEQAVEQVKYKAKQKLGYVTLPGLRREANANY